MSEEGFIVDLKNVPKPRDINLCVQLAEMCGI